MTCCPAHLVNYQVPNPCVAAPVLTEVPAPALAFTLEQNTSGFAILATVGAVNMYRVPGETLPNLSNGVVGGELGMRVDCGGGVVNFPDTIRVLGQLAAHDRQMIGFGHWNGYGSILTDGDGLNYSSVQVLDGATVLHNQSPIATANNGLMHETLFAAPVVGATGLRLVAGSKPAGGSLHANSSEVAPIWAWEGLMQWACNDLISCRIRPVNPFSGALRVLGGQAQGRFTVTHGGVVIFNNGVLSQANGPHEFLFDVPAGVTGTVTTNLPNNFSSLVVTEASPSFVLSGNTAQTFSISWNFDAVGCRPGIVSDGELRDVATGAVISNPQPCGGT